MKKFLLAAFVVTAAFLTGCNSAGSNDPKAVLVSFYEALGKKDIGAARKLATTESKQMLDMMEMGMKMGGDKATDDKYDKNKVEFGDSKVEGDKATVAVKDKNSGETVNWTLKKEGGAWKVAFDKSTVMTMGMDKMKEKGMDVADSTVNNSLDKLKDINTDSLTEKMKEATDKLDELKKNLDNK